MEEMSGNESKKTSGLTSAIEDELILEDRRGHSYLKSDKSYSKGDLEEFNNELNGIFDIDSWDKKMDFSNISDEGFIKPNSKTKTTTQTPPKTKPKQLRKIQYEAEISALKKRLGSVSSIRKNLGLNQRKLAHLLLVDPSAVNRWEKSGNDAPFYIYRALEWYSILRDKHPSMGNSFWLQIDNVDIKNQDLERIKQELKSDLRQELYASAEVKPKNVSMVEKNTLLLCVLCLCLGFFVAQLT